MLSIDEIAVGARNRARNLKETLRIGPGAITEFPRMDKVGCVTSLSLAVFLVPVVV